MTRRCPSHGSGALERSEERRRLQRHKKQWNLENVFLHEREAFQELIIPGHSFHRYEEGQGPEKHPHTDGLSIREREQGRGKEQEGN